MILLVKKLLAMVLNTPLVIESGTSGIWTYRKWSDGTAECWGKWSGTLSPYGSAVFYLYYTQIAYPNGFFIEEPNAHYSGRIGAGYCLTGTLFNASKNNIFVYAMSTADGTQPCEFFIYSIGKWK